MTVQLHGAPLSKTRTLPTLLIGALLLVGCDGDGTFTTAVVPEDESAESTDSVDAASAPRSPPLADAGATQMRDSAGAVNSSDASDCVKAQYRAQARALDIFILLDQSGSMQEDEDRWTPTTNAIKTFVGTKDLTNTGVALQYFPLGNNEESKCDPATYEKPDVALADLPGNAAAVSRSIDAHWFSKEECCDTVEHEGTPTRPAAEGAIRYMRQWLAAHPERAAVLLLATDGEPSSVCDDNEVEDVARVLAAAASSSPAIRTYVIGIGEVEELEELAVAGGTGQGALFVSGSGASAEQQLLTALKSVRNAALPCDYPLADGLDPRSINLEWTRNASAAPSTLVNVRGAAECSKVDAKGWFYDDPARPRRINLCPDTCTALSGDPSITVRIVEGCETVVYL